VSANGLITIAGGKLTTYRRMAERVLEAAMPFVDGAAPAGRSGIEPLAGGAAPDLAAGVTLPAELRTRLVERHGSDAAEVLACADGANDLLALEADVPLCAAEVRHAVRNEMARTLADVLERRSRLALFATARARAIAPRVAALVAAELGWTTERRAQELAAFLRQCDLRLAWRDLPSHAGVATAVGSGA